MSASARVRLRGIAKAFAGARVLRAVDLEVAPGEFCVCIGPSGCGKSTLLRLIAGLDDPSDGEIEIDGAAVTDLPPARRNVAMVFQSYALYPHMTAHENMAFGLRHQKLSPGEIERRVAAAARILHLQGLLGRKPRELSGGQRQRVAIGRAIVRQPKVFLFDEPLSNLDAALRVQTRVELARLHRELGSASTVYVTHDQTEAMTLADRIVLLRPYTDGADTPSVAQAGPPLALYHHPANRFVAGFIGSPAMNFLPAVVTGAADDALQLRVAGALDCRARVAAAGVRAGDAVTLGVRPEHVGIDAGDGGASAVVAHVEQLGEHGYAYLTLGDSATLVAKTQRTDLRVGERVPFVLPQEQLHVFRADGVALPRREVRPQA